MQSMQFMQIMRFGFELCEVYAVSTVCSFELLQSMLFRFVVQFGSKQLKLKCSLCGVIQFYAVRAVNTIYEVWF